jgi:hypothetical protein
MKSADKDAPVRSGEDYTSNPVWRCHAAGCENHVVSLQPYSTDRRWCLAHGSSCSACGLRTQFHRRFCDKHCAPKSAVAEKKKKDGCPKCGGRAEDGLFNGMCTYCLHRGVDKATCDCPICKYHHRKVEANEECLCPDCRVRLCLKLSLIRTAVLRVLGRVRLPAQGQARARGPSRPDARQEKQDPVNGALF